MYTFTNCARINSVILRFLHFLVGFFPFAAAAAVDSFYFVLFYFFRLRFVCCCCCCCFEFLIKRVIGLPSSKLITWSTDRSLSHTAYHPHVRVAYIYVCIHKVIERKRKWHKIDIDFQSIIHDGLMHFLTNQSNRMHFMPHSYLDIYLIKSNNSSSDGIDDNHSRWFPFLITSHRSSYAHLFFSSK